MHLRKKFILRKGAVKNRLKLKKYKNLFCSNACANGRRYQHRFVICETCGKKFRRNKGNDKYKRTFCSRICAGIGQIGEKNHSFNPKIPGKTKEERKRNTMRMDNQRRTHWKEVIQWAKSLPDKQCKKVMETIETLVEFKVKILNLKHLIRTEASL